MRNLAIWSAFGGVLGAVWLGGAVPRASADKAFHDEFVALYVKPDSEDPTDKAFAAAVDRAKCTICHARKTKRDRNRYGKALAKLLSRKTDTDDKEKIRAALKKVEAERSDPNNDKSPTFGELIQAGKLPSGEPKDGP